MKSLKIICVIILLLICFSNQVAYAQFRLNVRVGNQHRYRRFYNAPPPVYYSPSTVYVGSPTPGLVWINPHWRYNRRGNSILVPGHYRRW